MAELLVRQSWKLVLVRRNADGVRSLSSTWAGLRGRFRPAHLKIASTFVIRAETSTKRTSSEAGRTIQHYLRMPATPVIDMEL